MKMYKHMGHATAAPNMDEWKAAIANIDEWKATIEDKTTASVTGKSENYTIGAGPHGWVCPLCGRSVNPNFMHCSCGGWRYPNQPNWAPWYTTVTCKEETSTQPKTFCSGFMHIEGMD